MVIITVSSRRPKPILSTVRRLRRLLRKAFFLTKCMRLMVRLHDLWAKRIEAEFGRNTPQITFQFTSHLGNHPNVFRA